MDEIRVANFSLIAFWLLLTGFILAFGHRWPRLRAFRACMLAQWKPALVISLLFLLGMALGGRGVLNPYALAIFCEAMFGLALARGIPAFEPLPVAQAFARRGAGGILDRKGPLVSLLLALLFALLAAAAAVLIGSIGLSIAQSIFHETPNTSQAMQGFAAGPLQAFGLFLSGAGIAEETLWRLVVISLVWRWVKRPGWAVVIAALLFGAYHLSPLDGMYRTFWQFPASQFLASALIGLVWGWLFTRRGYETTVLAHTLSNFLPMILFP